jgi:hypothetical protein
MTHKFTPISESSQLIELTEFDLEAISAAGFRWASIDRIKKNLSRLDDYVNERVHGGWFGVAAAAVTVANGGPLTFTI